MTSPAAPPAFALRRWGRPFRPPTTMAQHLLKPTAKPGTFVHLLERDPRTHAVRFEIEAAFNREARLNATRVRITNDGTKCSFVDCRFGVSATIDIDPKRLSRARQLELLRTTVQRLDREVAATRGERLTRSLELASLARRLERAARVLESFAE